MNPYTYPSVKLNFNLQLKQVTQRWFRYAVDWFTAQPTHYEKANIVQGEYFCPREGGYFPLVILLHGVGDRSVFPCNLLARALAKKGIAAFVLHLVFHSSRMPQDMKKRFPALTSEGWLETFRISVIDARQVIDWAKSRVEINGEQIAIVGLSIGGMISAITMAIDKRISAGVFLVTGGNWEEITWKTKSQTARMGHDCTEAECHYTYSYYSQYLAQVAEKGLDSVTPVKECFLFDPMTYASFLRNRPVMMINGLWDRIIPKRASLDFWEACGKPAIIWLPATHITIYLWHPLTTKKIINFLKSTFKI